MKRITTILAILLSASVCLASGWNDFSLDIGDGYNVFRANSMDVCIGRADGSLILYPRDHDEVGPVVRYIVTPDYILTKNLGRTPRNLFEGDTFQDVDPSQEYFFIIAKANDEVHGPFSADEFSERPEIANLGELDWQIPKNPNFWLPIFGSLMFLAIATPILAIKFLWITIPVIVGLILLIQHIRKKRKKKIQPRIG
ncbi:MAG: hypothetical protein JXR78_15720 [Victivallales bacterium]|nr:hypothetical protein [Victivallales bacterium]